MTITASVEIRLDGPPVEFSSDEDLAGLVPTLVFRGNARGPAFEYPATPGPAGPDGVRTFLFDPATIADFGPQRAEFRVVLSDADGSRAYAAAWVPAHLMEYDR